MDIESNIRTIKARAGCAMNDKKDFLDCISIINKISMKNASLLSSLVSNSSASINEKAIATTEIQREMEKVSDATNKMLEMYLNK